MRVGDKVWFTDPGDDLSSGLYTIDWIGGEVYSLSNGNSFRDNDLGWRGLPPLI